MKKEWKKFIENLGVPVEFLHRDEFLERFNLKDIEFPAAFVKEEGDIKLIISSTEINNCKNIRI